MLPNDIRGGDMVLEVTTRETVKSSINQQPRTGGFSISGLAIDELQSVTAPAVP